MASSAKRKYLSAFPKKISAYLHHEHFSEEEQRLLNLFFEQKDIKRSEIQKQKNSLSAAESLVKRGIIKRKKRHTGIVYYLESLESFFTWVRSRMQERTERIQKEGALFMDHLRSSIGSAVRSKVTFYEGIDGIRDSYRHMLDHTGKEILTFFSFSENIQPELQNSIEKEFIPQRVKRGIFSRVLTTKTPRATYYKLMSPEWMMDLRMVSAKTLPLLNASIDLYDGYMRCMIFDELGGFAFVIDDSHIIRLQKSLFEMAWKNYQYMGEQQKIDPRFSESKESSWDHLYLTDNISFILKSIDERSKHFPQNLAEQWPKAKPELVSTSEGEKILKFCGLEVYSTYFNPYMDQLAQIATTHGGKILNIGFGMGVVDTFVEEQRATRKITEHHIVDLNEEIYRRAEKWRASQPHKDQIFLHLGNWEDVLPHFKKEKLVFDGIIYDAFPLEVDEIHRDSVRFLYSLIRLKLVKERTGILTFFLDSTDGFGHAFQRFLEQLGVHEMHVKKVPLKLPKRKSDLWEEKFIYAPVLTDVHYSS